MIFFEVVREGLQFRVGHVALADGGKSSDRRQQSRQQTFVWCSFWLAIKMLNQFVWPKASAVE